MGDQTPDFRTSAGAADIAARAFDLAENLPPGLKPLAALAYNYRWSWLPGAEDVFREINPHRWELSGGNPVKFLSDLWPSTRAHAERDEELRARVLELAKQVASDLDEPSRPRPPLEGPVAYMCAEYGIHASLPTYSGGLGVLAGDTLKEASDQRLSMVAVGLLYRRGYHRQRLDTSGRQLEYWVVNDPKSMPMARVSVDGQPLKLSVHVFGRETWFQVWRVDVGRVPLFLIDSQVPENDQVQRWYTARLYEGERSLRLAQYALLGIGGVRVLRALGIEPSLYHLNEGHPALGALELAAEDVASGMPAEEAIARVRERFVFTTHTPVPAGNETYGRDELLGALLDLPGRLGLDEEAFLDLFRTHPGDTNESPGISQLGIRASRTQNAVSALHGHVARTMWRPFFHAAGDEDVPITHVTNGVHMPTWLSEPFRALYDRYLGEGWESRAGDPRTWDAVDGIPDAELWHARCTARERLIAYVRHKSELDRLQRGERIEYVRGAATTLDARALTLGFARRLALYKRVYLLAHDPERATRLITGQPPVQLVVSGKAHPADEDGKNALRDVFALKRRSKEAANRIVVLEDYDMSVAHELVAGCDVWVNLPRRPMEASGTSGMKTTYNGALQLSVLDGWWAEAYDGSNGWAIDGHEGGDPQASDERDATTFLDLLEHQVIPLFYDRDESGVPQGWCRMVKAALRTCAPQFTAARMLNEYVERIYGSGSRLETGARAG
jgi:starch phosphorylase